MMTPLRGGQLGGGSFTGPDFGVDAQIADFARDQVAVLSAGIEDDDLRIGIQVTMVARPG